MDRRNIRRNRDVKKSCKLENALEADSVEREINAFEGCPLVCVLWSLGEFMVFTYCLFQQIQTAQDAANKQEHQVIMATTPTPPAPTSLGKQHVFTPGR